MYNVLINATYNGCRGNRISVLTDYSAKGYFLPGQSRKGCILREQSGSKCRALCLGDVLQYFVHASVHN